MTRRVLNCCPYKVRVSYLGQSYTFKVDFPGLLREHSTEVEVIGFPYPVVEAHHQEAEVQALVQSILQRARRGDLVLVSSLVGEALVDSPRAQRLLKQAGVRVLSPIVSGRRAEVSEFRLWI